MKKIKHEKRKGNRTLEILALFFALLCLAMGFLALSSHFKVQSQTTVHPDELNFRVVFSTSNKSEKIEPVEPKVEPRSSSATAEDARIINGSNPKITNLRVNFTEPDQRARYTFYIYNAGEYMAYLNNIIYSNVVNLNQQKVCIPKNSRSNESVNKACDNIEISIKIGDLHTNKSLYGLSGRYLRPRTAQMVEVTIEYKDNKNTLTDDFEVIFGDIYLQYSMFDNETPTVS